MGLRATSITKYEVEYGGVQGFNYDPETLAGIIGHYCDDFYSGQECPDTEVIWEIDKKQFADMVASLEGMSETDFSDLMEFIGESGDYTKEYVVKVLKGFFTDTQEDSNYVRIGWL